MKVRMRIRKLAKWSAVVFTLMAAAMWVGSGKYNAAHQFGGSWYGWSMSVWRGRVHVWQWGKAGAGGGPVGLGAASGQSWGGWEWRPSPSGFGLDWRVSSFKQYGLPHVAVPLWWVVVPMGAGAAWLWRRDAVLTRRYRMRHCMKCGYDRSGLAEGVRCPECGTMPNGLPELVGSGGGR